MSQATTEATLLNPPQITHPLLQTPSSSLPTQTGLPRKPRKAEQLKVKPALKSQENSLQTEKLKVETSKGALKTRNYQIVLKAENFPLTSQLDFNIFCSLMSRTKAYSVMLVDAFGRIVYANKQAGEHYEGSLNNFKRICLQDLVILQLRQAFVRGLKSMSFYANAENVIRFMIYSKNSKRRYRNVAINEKLSPEDIFYRFLKCLAMRVRPMTLALTGKHKPEGFWNYELTSQAQPLQCFMLETRLNDSMPDLSMFDLDSDKMINRFLISHRKKAGKKQKEAGRADSEESQKSAPMISNAKMNRELLQTSCKDWNHCEEFFEDES